MGVRFPSTVQFREVFQLVEASAWNGEGVGSNPIFPTKILCEVLEVDDRKDYIFPRSRQVWATLF